MIFSGVLIFAGLCLLALAGLMVSVYNGLVSLRNQVDRAWLNIDIVLEQRHEEIPKLVSVCEQFSIYERSTLDRIVIAREKYLAARSTNDKVMAANNVSDQLRGLMAIGESYPQLQSNALFVQFQTRISALEGQIADRKELFNDTATNFNTRCQQFPSSIFAGNLGYKPVELYKAPAESKAAVSVKLTLPA